MAPECPRCGDPVAASYVNEPGIEQYTPCGCRVATDGGETGGRSGDDTDHDDVQKIVVNRGYGGFSVHDDTIRWLRERGCSIAEGLVLPGEYYDDGSGPREEDGLRDCAYPRRTDIRVDEHLVKAVENGITRDLSIVEVPAGVGWVITEYDGAETVREKHRVYPSGEYASGIASSDEIGDPSSTETDRPGGDE